MLSRTAASLYWMSRQLERAENMARILDATNSMALMPLTRGAVEELAAPLTISGLQEPFHEHHTELSMDTLLQFFVFDETNDASIFSSIRQARDNALAVRGRINSEIWENINATWLELSQIRRRGLHSYGVKGFFDWIKQRSHLFRGATYGTMLRNDAFHFIRLGTFIERTDNTARILDVKYQIMRSRRADNQAVDFYQWNALLQSLSAYEAYHELYKRGITERNVAELLILSAEMPRSLRFCVGAMMEILELIEGSRGQSAKRQTAELNARLAYGEIDYIFAHGLHEYLTDLLRRISTIGENIHRDYWEGA